jgi:small conductance mechanosensitive channel
MIEKVIIAGAEVIGGLIAGPLVKTVILRLSRKVYDKGAMTFIGSFANIAIIVVMCIIAMDQLGMNMSAVVGAFSALGLGISLALKDNMANVAGGLQILLTRPFVVGDYVKVGKHEGTVREVELMYTTMITSDQQEVVVPNSKMISKIVTNYSKEPNRRIKIEIPVFKLSDLDHIEQQVKAIAQADTRVLKDPAPIVAAKKIRHEFVDLELYCFCLYNDYESVRYDLTKQIAEQIKNNPTQ